MGLHLYCLLPDGKGDAASGAPSAGGSAPAPPGVGHAPVQAVSVAGFRVWVSDHSEAPRPTLENIRAHDAIVRAAMERSSATPLPMRFGQWFSGTGSLAERLDEAGPAYGDALARVQGKLELGVRIEVDPSSSPRDSREEETPATGREYMESLARRRRTQQEWDARGRRLAGELRRRLGDLVQDERIRTLAPPEGLVSVAHLVAPDDEDEWARIVDRFDRESEALTCHRTGPWPPYSFAQQEES